VIRACRESWRQSLVFSLHRLRHAANTCRPRVYLIKNKKLRAAPSNWMQHSKNSGLGLPSSSQGRNRGSIPLGSANGFNHLDGFSSGRFSASPTFLQRTKPPPLAAEAVVRRGHPSRKAPGRGGTAAFPLLCSAHCRSLSPVPRCRAVFCVSYRGPRQVALR
jgi:hypothetical protein